MPRRYSNAHKNSIHQDERNLLRTESATKGGELVSETGHETAHNNLRSRAAAVKYDITASQEQDPLNLIFPLRCEQRRGRRAGAEHVSFIACKMTQINKNKHFYEYVLHFQQMHVSVTL
ncbi:Hypothetical predicted protein [Scomber scombrus]|uniref:Uncharacterized protein n=1 Tax=Scomber scombrus TaxID=13677 RepID=A0AAV1PGF8_SCOSC